MNELNYWVRLSLCFGPGSEKPDLLLQDFESPGSIFENGPGAFDGVGYLTQEEKDALRNTGPEKADAVITECGRSGVQVILRDDPLYPECLRESDTAPCVLYLKGEAALLGASPIITVTGSGKLSDYGKRVTGNICYELARAGAVTAAGFLSETDRYVHLGALRAGRGSVAVLDCGIDQRSPLAGKDLSEDKIVFVSELPPGTSRSKAYESAYHRLLTGISLGTLVTELGGSDPGSGIAETASDLGKDLFCVPPHDLFDPLFSGVIRYLRQGAYPVFCAKDLLGEYEALFPGSFDMTKLLDQYAGGRKNADPETGSVPAPGSIKAAEGRGGVEADEEIRSRPKSVPVELDENEKLVYNCMEFLPKTVAEIAAASSLPQEKTLSVLNALGKKGYVVSYSGSRFGLLNK